MYRVMTTARISLLVSLVLCSACPGGGGGSDPDGRPADAGVDGAPGPAVLHVVEGLTAWDFHDVAVDQQSVALALTVANTGATASGTLAVTVTGADAAAFRLDATTDCDDGIVLAPAATCAVRVRFAPTALGARAATLTIDAGGGAPVTVDLTGTGVATAIAIAPAPVALGAVHAGVADATAIATVSNTGADTAAISAVTVTGAGFTLASTTCAGTLAPATSCTATVRFAPTAIGAATGDLVVVSDRGQASAPLAGTGTGAVTVTKVAVTGGAGTVTSAPAGIACGATCSALFGATVVLTAEADATSVFTGWSGACMGVGPCVIDPTVADQAVTATFTGQTVLTIAATGTGTGAVYVDGVACALPCTREVNAGTTLHLDAITPSTFAGWSGACAGAAIGCDVTVTTSTTATAAFDLAAGERWTATLPGVPLERAVIASDGALLVAGHDLGSHELVVAKYAASGAQTWLARFPSVATGAAIGMVADGAGGAIVVDEQTLPAAFGDVVVRDVSTTGGTTWTATIPSARWYGAGYMNLGDAADATASGGVVVTVETATGALIRRYDAAGAATWTATAAMAPFDVAVASTGVVHVMLDDGAAYNTIGRWTATGAALTNLIVPTPGQLGSFYETLDIDAADHLLLTAVPDVAAYKLRAVSLAGATLWTSAAYLRDDGAGVTATLTGALVLDVGGAIPPKFDLATFTAAGALTGTHTVERPDSPTGVVDRLLAGATAGTAAGDAIVVGDWMTAPAGGATRHDGFVRAYAP